MIFSNDLQKKIVEHLLLDTRLFYLEFNGTHFIASWRKENEDQGNFIDLKKTHSEKSLAKVQIHIYTDTNNSQEVGCRIQLYLNSYCEWETFFEGWVENLDELKSVIKMIGL